MRTSLIAAAVCLSIVSLARAGDVAASMRKPVNIPAQPLGLALQTLAKECDRQVLYRSEIVGTYRTASVSGELTFDEALQQLLSGTSLTYRYLDDKTVTIDAREPAMPRASTGAVAPWPVAALQTSSEPGAEPARSGWLGRFRLAAAHAQAADQSSSATQASDDVDTVVVTASGSQVELVGDYAGGQVARGGRVGLFGNLDIMDTPFNFTNYTAEFMRNLQARSVADVAQADPGVRVARGYGNFQELYVVRGFPVYSDDMSYNGLYGLLPRQYIAAEFLERVEIFRGANSFLNGAAPGGSGIGGSFNLVPKRAPNKDLTRFTAGLESGGEYLVAGDVARRFGSDGQFGVRANAVRRDGDTVVDDESRTLNMWSLGMDFRGEKARFSADLGWQNHHIDAPRPSVTPSVPVPDDPQVPDAPDSDANFTQKWSFTEERDLFGVIRGEYDFNEHAKAWAATGMRNGTEHNILTNPTSDPDGNATVYRFDNFRKDRITTSEVGIRGEFKTGPVSHRVSASGSIFRLSSKNAYDFIGFFSPVAFDLYDPVQVPPITGTPDFFGGELFDPLRTTLTRMSSFALADILSFNEDKLLLILGGRHQKLEQNIYDYNSGALLTKYDDSANTPVVGVVVKPSKEISIYGNYAEALVKGDTAPFGSGVTNPDEPLPPFISKQLEAGVKYDTGSFGGTAAVFRTNRQTGLVDGSIYKRGGQQRNRGLELNLYGQATPQLRILGGVTFLSAKSEKTTDPVLEGERVIGVPKVQANIGLDWDVPGVTGLALDGRLVHTSKEVAIISPQPDGTVLTASLPSWTRLDIGGRYVLPINDKNVTLRLRVDNVFDKDYWASTGGEPTFNYMVLGAPRLISFSASVDL